MDKLPSYQECRHCFAPVTFKEDGICISCGRSRSDTRGVDPDITAVTVEVQHKVPCCCFICGAHTDRGTILKYRSQTSPSLIGRLIGLLPGNTRARMHKQLMPVCEPCSPNLKGLKPLTFQAGRDMRLKVHRRFRAQYEELNGRPYLDWG